MQKCPCCGQSVPEPRFMVDLSTNTLSYMDHIVDFTPMEAEILKVMEEAYPRPAQSWHILERVYGQRTWPKEAKYCLLALIHRIRRKLAPIGVKIETKVHVGYKLVL